MTMSFADSVNFIRLSDGSFAHQKPNNPTWADIVRNGIPLDDRLENETCPLYLQTCKSQKRKSQNRKNANLTELEDTYICEECNQEVDTIVIVNKKACCKICTQYRYCLNRGICNGILTGFMMRTLNFTEPLSVVQLCIKCHVPKITRTSTGPFLQRPHKWSKLYSGVRAAEMRRDAYNSAGMVNATEFAVNVMSHLVAYATILQTLEAFPEFITDAEKLAFSNIHTPNAILIVNNARKKVAKNMMLRWPDSWLDTDCDFHPEVSPINLRAAIDIISKQTLRDFHLC
jgi:hypothetical protein